MNLEQTKVVTLSVIGIFIFAFIFLVIPMITDIKEERKAKEQARIEEENRPVVFPLVRIRVPAGEKKVIHHPYPYPRAQCSKSNIVDKNKIKLFSREHLIEVTNRTNKAFTAEIHYFPKHKRLDCRQTLDLLIEQGLIKG